MAESTTQTINLLIWIQIGQISTLILSLAAAAWAFRKWWIRDELFPRMAFEVSVNFVGCKDGEMVCELVAMLENKGIVPLKIKNLTFVLRGIRDTNQLVVGDETVRGQLLFGEKLQEGRFIPSSWLYSFIYPGVKTEYNFVTAIPENVLFVRMQGDFEYFEREESHHAAKVLSVPRPTASGSGAPA